MSELEDRLGSILQSPEKMAQIMQLAKTFSSGSETKVSDAPQPAQETMDPRMMAALMKLMRELSAPDSSAELLHAVTPYLRRDRRERVERAIKIARIAKLAGKAFGEMGENLG